MKYNFIIIALFAVLIATSSAKNEEIFSTNVGDLAPIVKIDNDASDDACVDTAKMQGEYVLLTFWSGTDAASRVACSQYTAWAEQLNNLGSNIALQHVSVNFDSDKSLFNELVRRDNLKKEMQFNVQGRNAQRIITDFRLEGCGYGSILIGPDGRIIAKNPTKRQLSQALARA